MISFNRAPKLFITPNVPSPGRPANLAPKFFYLPSASHQFSTWQVQSLNQIQPMRQPYLIQNQRTMPMLYQLQYPPHSLPMLILLTCVQTMSNNTLYQYKCHSWATTSSTNTSVSPLCTTNEPHILFHTNTNATHYVCSLSLWRVARGSKHMFLELIHGLFIT